MKLQVVQEQEQPLTIIAVLLYKAKRGIVYACIIEGQTHTPLY